MVCKTKHSNKTRENRKSVGFTISYRYKWFFGGFFVVREKKISESAHGNCTLSLVNFLPNSNSPDHVKTRIRARRELRSATGRKNPQRQGKRLSKVEFDKQVNFRKNQKMWKSRFFVNQDLNLTGRKIESAETRKRVKRKNEKKAVIFKDILPVVLSPQPANNSGSFDFYGRKSCNAVPIYRRYQAR